MVARLKKRIDSCSETPSHRTRSVDCYASEVPLVDTENREISVAAVAEHPDVPCSTLYNPEKVATRLYPATALPVDFRPAASSGGHSAVQSFAFSFDSI